MLFLELVFDGVGRGIAAQPELLDELLALFVGVQLLEGLALFIRDDVDDVFVEPLLPGGFQLFLERRFLLLDLLFRQRLGDGFAFCVERQPASSPAGRGVWEMAGITSRSARPIDAPQITASDGALLSYFFALSEEYKQP